MHGWEGKKCTLEGGRMHREQTIKSPSEKHGREFEPELCYASSTDISERVSTSTSET